MVLALRPASAMMLAAAALALAACTSKPRVFPALSCGSDPCCGGPANIDCAENPDASCVEPGDACTTYNYGCNAGTFFVSKNPPAACTQGPDDDVVLIVVDDAGAAADDASDADAVVDATLTDSASAGD